MGLVFQPFMQVARLEFTSWATYFECCPTKWQRIHDEIIIIEDNPTYNTFISKFLAKAGFKSIQVHRLLLPKTFAGSRG